MEHRIVTKTTMSLEHFHDFYFLEALSAAITTESARQPDARFRHSVTRLEYDVREATENIVPNIATRTFMYLYAACLGEARHARNSNAADRFIPQIIKSHRGECFERAANYRPTKSNLDTLVNVFKQDWGSGFGGKAWLGIAEALRYYFKVTPAAFIDHVIDLEHNNGTAFNKSDARRTLYFETRYPGELKYFLDYKFSCNILEREPQLSHKLQVTRRVYRLIERYCNIFNKKPPYWVEAGLPALGDYVVEWGDEEISLEEKWYTGIDVSGGNFPTTDKLLHIMGLEDIYFSEYTLKELTSKIKKAKKDVLKKIAPKYMTKVLRKELDNRLKGLLEYGKTHCKTPKCKVTYPVLPCKAKNDYGNLTLHFALPYQGVGNKTDEGFSVNFGVIVPDYALRHGDAFIESTYGGIALHVDGYKFNLPNQPLEALLD